MKPCNTCEEKRHRFKKDRNCPPWTAYYKTIQVECENYNPVMRMKLFYFIRNVVWFFADSGMKLWQDFSKKEWKP